MLKKQIYMKKIWLIISKRIRDTILTEIKRSPTFAAEKKNRTSNDSSRTI